MNRRSFLRHGLGACATILPYWAPSWRRAIVSPKCFDVRTFGARGDGVAFDDQALVTAVEAAKATGGPATVFFPPGVYRVANGRWVEFRDCRDLAFVGPGATLRNDTDTGNDGGVVIFTGTTENVTVDGLTFDTSTASPNSYDNTLNFLARPPQRIRNVWLRNCRFVRASNKAVNVDGTVDGMVIEHCSFTDSHFNSNPLASVNRFGAIYFANDAKVDVSNVTIRANAFRDNWLFCVAMDQSDFGDGHYYFRNIRINGNDFLHSTGGVWVRGEYVWIEGNYFEGIGLSRIEERYSYVEPLGRFLSAWRAGQEAERANTVWLQRAAVVETDTAHRVWITGNSFVGCVRSQTQGRLRPPGPLCVAADQGREVTIEGNSAYEIGGAPGPPSLFDCSGGADAGWTCGNNPVLTDVVPPAPPAAGPLSTNLARYGCSGGPRPPG